MQVLPARPPSATTGHRGHRHSPGPARLPSFFRRSRLGTNAPSPLPAPSSPLLCSSAELPVAAGAGAGAGAEGAGAALPSDSPSSSSLPLLAVCPPGARRCVPEGAPGAGAACCWLGRLAASAFSSQSLSRRCRPSKQAVTRGHQLGQVPRCAGAIQSIKEACTHSAENTCTQHAGTGGSDKAFC